MIVAPDKAQEEYEKAKAISDSLLEAVQANDAMGIESEPTLCREFSRALKATRFWQRRLNELAA